MINLYGRLGLGTAMAAAMLATPAAAATWISDADGNWADAVNWSGGLLPGLLDDVLIDVGGPAVRTITHSAGTSEVGSIASNENLTVTGSTLAVSGGYSNTARTSIGAGTLRLNGLSTLAELTMGTGSILAGSGQVTVQGPSFNLGTNRHSGTGTTLYLGPVSVAGATNTVRLDGGRRVEYRGGFTTSTGFATWDLGFTGGGGGTLRNGAGSLLLDQAGTGRIHASFTGPVQFENAGVYRKAGGPGGVTTIEVPFTNGGTVEVTSGRVEIIGMLSNASSIDTLTGGRWIVDRPLGSDNVLWFDPSSGLGSIVNLAADITLSGGGSAAGIRTGASFTGPGTGSKTLVETLARIETDGVLRLLNGALVEIGNRPEALTNNGLIVLGGSDPNTQARSELRFGFGSALTNNGEVRGNGLLALLSNDDGAQNNGVIRASGGLLTVEARNLFGGTLATDPGASFALRGLLVGAVPIVDIIDHQGIGWSQTSNGTDFRILVTTDYRNAGFGTGDAFDRLGGEIGNFINAEATGAGQVLSALGLTGGDTAAPVLALGNRRVGDAVPVLVTISNSGAETILRGAVRTAGAPSLEVTGGESFMAAPGGSAQFSISTFGAAAGTLVGQSVVVANNFGNVQDQTLSVTGSLFRLAVADIEASTLPLVVRVGDSVSGLVTLRNIAAADGFSEGLVVAASASGDIGPPDAAGFTVLAGDSLTVSAAFDTASAGTRQGVLAFGFGSGGAGSSGLDPIAIGDAAVTLSVLVNNHAAPAFARFGTALGYDAGLGGYLLDLGTVRRGGLLDIGGLALGNFAVGPADDLSGAITLLSGGPWSVGGAFDIGVLAAGDLSGVFGVTLDRSAIGSYVGAFDFAGKGTNASDLIGEDRFARLFVRVDVQAVPEPQSWAMMILGFGAVGMAARRRRQGAGAAPDGQSTGATALAAARAA